MYNGSPGDSACAARCSQPTSPAWLNQVEAVAGNMMIDDAKIGGITPDMLSLSGRNEDWFMYALRPPWRRASFPVIRRCPLPTNTTNQVKPSPMAAMTPPPTELIWPFWASPMTPHPADGRQGTLPAT